MLNIAAKRKEFKIRSGLNGIQFNIDPNCKVANAAMGSNRSNPTITVPAPSSLWTEEQVLMWEYDCEHEIGHVLPDCIDSYDMLHEKKIDCSSLLGHILNIMEDFRQEYRGWGEFAGRKGTIMRGRALYHKKMDYPSMFSAAAKDANRAVALTMFTWDTYCRESWLTSVAGQSDAMVKAMTPQQLEWMSKLTSGDYETLLKVKTLTAFEMYDLCIRIMSEVFEVEPPDEENTSESSESKADGDDEQEGEGEGEEGGEDEEGETEEGAQVSLSGEVNYSDLLAHPHHDGTPPNHGLHINYDEGTGIFEERGDDKYKILDYTTREREEYEFSARESQKRIDKLEVSTGLAKQVRRMLQVRSQATYQHGLKRGKISSRSLYRAGLGNCSAATKVFKKKQEKDILNTAVTVLVDKSGSMTGMKDAHAGIACAMLNEAIGGIRVPLEIVGFTEDWENITHSILKKHDKSVSWDDLIYRHCKSGDEMFNSNSDGESILWAMARLTKRKEKRKILIVLSDGSPASTTGDADFFTQHVIGEIEKSGIVEIYGIGIMDTNVKRLYKEHAVINEASELESALLKVIEHKIIG